MLALSNTDKVMLGLPAVLPFLGFSELGNLLQVVLLIIQTINFDPSWSSNQLQCQPAELQRFYYMFNDRSFLARLFIFLSHGSVPLYPVTALSN